MSMRKKFIHVVVDGDFCVNMTNPDAMMHNTTTNTEMPPSANATTFFKSKVDFVLKKSSLVVKTFPNYTSNG